MTSDRNQQARPAFSIGSQNAGNINNVAGDMTVYGGQKGELRLTIADALQNVDDLRQVLSGLDLPPEARTAATGALDAATDELKQPEPDKKSVAERLEAFTHILMEAGALAKAGMALAVPLQQLATWLGPMGVGLLALVAN